MIAEAQGERAMKSRERNLHTLLLVFRSTRDRPDVPTFRGINIGKQKKRLGLSSRRTESTPINAFFKVNACPALTRGVSLLGIVAAATGLGRHPFSSPCF